MNGPLQSSGDTPPLTIGVAEVSHHLGVTPETIRRRARDGRFPEPDFRDGGRLRWVRTRFFAWLEGQEGQTEDVA